MTTWRELIFSYTVTVTIALLPGSCKINYNHPPESNTQHMPGLQRELIFRFGLKSVRFADATGKDEKSVAVLNSFTSAYHLHVLKRFAWLDNFWYNLSTNKIYLLLRYVYDPRSVYIYKYQINRITFNVNNNNGKNIIYRLFRAWVVSYLGTFLLKYFIFANQKICLHTTYELLR